MIRYSPRLIKVNFVLLCDYTVEYLDSFNTLTCFLTKTIEQLKPIKFYNNFKENRLQLIKDQQNKVGVYCLVNLVNGHIYVGSSINIASRMRNYLNNTFLKI